LPFTVAEMHPINFQKILGLVLLLWLALPNISAAQRRIEQDTNKGGVIKIIHVGNMIEDLQGFDKIKWISNGFRLRIDSTNMFGDSAVIINDDRVFAYGNIVIQQGDSLEVFTDTLYYTRADDIAELRGEVVLKQGSKQLWTTDLRYYLGERYGEYHKGGVLVDGDLQVSSETGIYKAWNEEITFRDSVIVLHPKFNLAADSMKYLAGESKVLFTGPTTINTAQQSRIYCESGYYDLKTETSEFNRNNQYVDADKTATADTIRYNAKRSEITMLGNVIVLEKDRRITGDTLEYAETTGDIRIKGDPAHYQDSSRNIVSAEIYYNKKTDKVSTKGESIIRDGSMVLKAEQSDYSESTGLGRAMGNVIWVDTVSNIGVMADVLDYDMQDQYILSYKQTKRPLFFTIVDGDTLYIAADTLNMYTVVDTTIQADSFRMIRAYHNVRLYKSDMQGKADSLVFHGVDSVFTFFGDPVLWTDSTQFSGDTILMTMKEKKLDEIVLQQRALIISEVMKTYYDQIKGKSIIADFDSSFIRQMWVTGNAESIYYAKDDNGAFIGVNKTICSKMQFTFLNNEIELLKYYGENTSNMMPMGQANHDSMRLEGFNWRAGERPLTIADLLK
jgi:lipopolysaccharide export system protein LptA